MYKSKAAKDVLNKIKEHMEVHNLFHIMEHGSSVDGTHKQYRYVITKGQPHDGIEGNNLNKRNGFYVDIYFREFTLNMFIGESLIHTCKSFNEKGGWYFTCFESKEGLI